MWNSGHGIWRGRKLKGHCMYQWEFWPHWKGEPSTEPRPNKHPQPLPRVSTIWASSSERLSSWSAAMLWPSSFLPKNQTHRLITSISFSTPKVCSKDRLSNKVESKLYMGLKITTFFMGFTVSKNSRCWIFAVYNIQHLKWKQFTSRLHGVFIC